MTADPPLYGIIKWVGSVLIPSIGNVKVAGIELDDFMEGGTDGTFQDRRYFVCEDGYGWLVPAKHCVRDMRFNSPIQGKPSVPTDVTASIRNRASKANG
jgi:dynactin complex subunit